MKRKTIILIAVIAVVVILAVGLTIDYNGQQEKIRAIEDRVELVEMGLERSNHDASSVRALRGLFQSVQEDSILISSRWVSDRRRALWEHLDKVDEKLKALENRYGVR